MEEQSLESIWLSVAQSRGTDWEYLAVLQGRARVADQVCHEAVYRITHGPDLFKALAHNQMSEIS